MNRREAVAALVAMPGLVRVEKADLKPTDVIVVEYEGVMHQEGARRLRQQLEAIWPDHKIVVLSDGVKLKVVNGA